MSEELRRREKIEQIIGELWYWAKKYSVLQGTTIHKEFTDILDRLDKLE